MNAGVILLVEDNAKDEALVLRAIRKSGLVNEVAVTRDGAEALDFLFCAGPHAHRNAVDVPALVLLDLNLPRIGGLDVLRRIRGEERTKLLPVCILTSSDEERDLLDGYKSGANSYMRKPVEFTAFASAVQQLGLHWRIIVPGGGT